MQDQDQSNQVSSSKIGELEKQLEELKDKARQEYADKQTVSPIRVQADNIEDHFPTVSAVQAQEVPQSANQKLPQANTITTKTSSVQEPVTEKPLPQERPVEDTPQTHVEVGKPTYIEESHFSGNAQPSVNIDNPVDNQVSSPGTKSKMVFWVAIGLLIFSLVISAVYFIFLR